MGPSHVRQRHEPVFSIPVLGTHDPHFSAGSDHNSAVARHHLGRSAALQSSDDFLLPLIPLHRFITVAALITGAVQFIFLFNLVWSIYKGEKAGPNPWRATSLEWTVSSPPPVGNFNGELARVNHGPYEYGETAAGRDFVLQSDPADITVNP